jgi:hypothetical protein
MEHEFENEIFTPPIEWAATLTVNTSIPQLLR